MIAWIMENFGTILITAVLIAIVAAIIVHLFRKKKKGGSCSCGCGCENCAAAGRCCHKE